MIKECISKFPDESKSVFTEIAEYAVFLGYTPKWVKVRANGKAVNGDSLTFSKAKVKRTLLKIRKGNRFNRDMPCLVLTFFASSDYSDIFKQGIKQVIEGFDGKYTGCYGCGKCENGKLQGYVYIYPDGKKVFRCGGDLIELPPISAGNVPEIRQLMKKQDEYFLKLVKRSN